MYVHDSLGEPFRPRRKTPAQLPSKSATKLFNDGWVVKDGHRRFCGPAPSPSDRELHCDLELRVRFRRAFDKFVREVESAYVRWTTRPTVQALIKKLQKNLKEWHQEMLNSKVLDNDPLVLVAGLHYRRSNGSWLVTSSDLRQYRRLIDL